MSNSPATRSDSPNLILRDLPYMGVIYVVVEALKLGYNAEDPSWANLGQGQPEVGPMAGAPERLSEIPVLPGDYAYGPVEGLKESREAVAAHYNRLYRRGMKSQYTFENVAIGAGGRLTLTRAVAALDRVKLGYFVPDYTAYEDLLGSFDRFETEMILLEAKNKFSISPENLRTRIRESKLNGLIISNPCNPTGRVISGQELAAWLEISRSENCALLLDEYYSHYIWKEEAAAGPVSAAAYVEDVNIDQVVLFDGLTKNFRYPGWRLGWSVGPKDLIRRITAAGSFVDGGPPRPMQRAAIEILSPARADKETEAVRKVFKVKRDLTVAKLKEVGVRFPLEPESTFYAFGDISGLKAPLNTCMPFFRKALEHKVLTVPGEFFDVNPGKQRTTPSTLSSFIRFSYGPPLPILEAGLMRLQEMIKRS